MLDINGHPIAAGDYAQLLVRVEEIDQDGLRRRKAMDKAMHKPAWS
jgi:hypothetical protein